MFSWGVREARTRLERGVLAGGGVGVRLGFGVDVAWERKLGGLAYFLSGSGLPSGSEEKWRSAVRERAGGGCLHEG